MVKITVRIIEVENKKFIEIEVKDTGIGIDEEDQKKLFKLFGFIKHKGRLNTRGIGLGLMIAKKIVEQYNGKIKLESHPGIGSTFTFTFALIPERMLSEISAPAQDLLKINSEELVYRWKPMNERWPVRYFSQNPELIES